MSKKKGAMKETGLFEDESEDTSMRRQEEGSAPTASPLTFPLRLMRLLERNDRTKGIYWLEGGKQFAIHTEDILPTLVNDFQGAKWLSFTRTLNKWGFKKVLSGKLPPKTVAYYCPHFQRDNPHLIRNMTNHSKAGNRKGSWELQTAQPAQPAQPSPAIRQLPAEPNANELAAARASLGPGIGMGTSPSFAATSPRLEARASTTAAPFPLALGQLTSATRPDLQGRSLGQSLPLGSHGGAWSHSTLRTDALLHQHLTSSLGLGTAASLQHQLLPNLPLDAAARALRTAQLAQLSSSTPSRQVSQLDAALALMREQHQLQVMARARSHFGASRTLDPPDEQEEEGNR